MPGASFGTRQVGLHFTITGRVPNEAPGLHLKTAVMLGWFAGSYTLLTFWATTWWQASALAISVGMAMAGIGFNIQHDGGHGSYSRRESVNLIMAFALDVLGASSYVWSWKHNVFHHSNPNIAGLDADIDIQPFCRLAPAQRRRAWHRFQHLYIWFLYSLLTVKWQFVDDFKELASGRIGGQHFARPRGWRLWSLVAGKVIFLSWTFVLPLLLHSVLRVALCFTLASLVLGLTLAITFQLAHAVEGAAFSSLGESGRASTEWAVHQVEASMNFAPGNRVLTWYLGGLNYQIEHHLFPRVCHLHLRDLSSIVQTACLEYGVNYRVHPTASAALASHARWVHRLGQTARGARQWPRSPKPEWTSDGQPRGQDDTGPS